MTSTTPTRQAALAAEHVIYHAKETRIETAKAELAAEHGLPRDARFDMAWAIAWDHGHASGISEVKSFFGDLVPLLKP